MVLVLTGWRVAVGWSEAFSMCKYAILKDAKMTSCQSVNSMPEWALIFFKYNITSSGKYFMRFVRIYINVSSI